MTKRYIGLTMPSVVLLILLNISCNINHKKKYYMEEEFIYLIELVNEETSKKTIFVDNYVPSVMIRKGFDYVDSYKTSLATLNYFLFEKKAIERYQSLVRQVDITFYRCLRFNDEGRMHYLIKKKIQIKTVDADSLGIDFTNYENGTYRFYNGEIITEEQLVLKTMDASEFDYIYIEHKNTKTIYQISISNNICNDVIYNAFGKNISGNPFYEAEFVYNEDGDFIKLKIIN
jgi:hypothetical protein